MFTGIVEGMAAVRGAEDRGAMRRLALDLGPLAEGVQVGESIAVSGVCLTVADLAGARAAFDVVAETLARTTLGTLQAGDVVNIERSLRLGDRLGGHFVQGHVDGVGTIRRRWREGESIYMRIAFPKALAPYFVYTGSVAVDGVSLTVAKVLSKSRVFDVCIIPHTLRETTFSRLRPGRRVNLEVDILAKYVLRSMETSALCP